MNYYFSIKIQTENLLSKNKNQNLKTRKVDYIQIKEANPNKKIIQNKLIMNFKKYKE